MKLHLWKVRLNAGGYDSSGVYFGVCKPGESVYEYHSEEEGRYHTVRACGREDAKRKIRAHIPNARFFR